MILLFDDRWKNKENGGTIRSLKHESPSLSSRSTAETKIINYRHYNPMDGKWSGRYPLGENGVIDNFDDYENIDFTQITNLYAFGSNDPINGYDVIAESWVGILRFFWNLLRDSLLNLQKGLYTPELFFDLNLYQQKVKWESAPSSLPSYFANKLTAPFFSQFTLQ